MPETFNLRVVNTVEAIPPASEAAEAWLAERQVAPNVVFLVTLAIEELVTNCIKYGYDDADAHTIDIELSVDASKLTMVVADDGHPFNPLAATPPDLSLAIEDRPIGGLGIHMLRELTDEMTYERRDGANRVTLIKRVV